MSIWLIALLDKSKNTHHQISLYKNTHFYYRYFHGELKESLEDFLKEFNFNLDNSRIVNIKELSNLHNSNQLKDSHWILPIEIIMED